MWCRCVNTVIPCKKEPKDNEDDLSYVVPMSLGLVMKVGGMQVPEISWENQQIPESVRDTKLTINDLIRFGHVQV
jgi:hypothetical protein